MALVGEDLALLLLTAKGRLAITRQRFDLALAGAVLGDLTLAGRVGRSGPDDLRAEGVTPGRVVVIDRRPTGDALLDSALTRIADRSPTKPAALLPKLVDGLRATVLTRLVDQGAVRTEHRQVLRVFSADRWFVVDKTRLVDLESRLHSSLVLGLPADAHTAGLIALLRVVGRTNKVADGPDRKIAKARARQFMADSWVAGAVRRAIMNAESSD